MTATSATLAYNRERDKHPDAIAKRRARYERDGDKARAAHREWLAKNKEHCKEYAKSYGEKNREVVNAKAREAHRRKADAARAAGVPVTSPGKLAYIAAWQKANHDHLKKWARERAKKKYAENPQKFRDRGKAYASKHKDKRAASIKAWTEKNKSRVAAYAVEYNKKNAERIREYTRRYRESRKEHFNALKCKSYKKHRAKRLEAAKRYYEDNKDKICHDSKMRAYKVKGAIGSHTKEQWQALLAEHEWKCSYCGACIAGVGKATRDHVIPITSGGSNDIGNIVPACHRCNSSKNRYSLESFLKRKAAGVANVGC